MCRQLLKRNLDVEKELNREVTKRRKIEESVQTLKEIENLRTQAETPKVARRRSSSKQWESYSRQQHGNIKKESLQKFDQHLTPVVMYTLNRSLLN